MSDIVVFSEGCGHVWHSRIRKLSMFGLLSGYFYA
ncbi:hypothetical protein CLOBOL_04240 [Enterocloster bolteae ATCC BAA-613]|uniref:Uncharacterized protein n=1 Tax=Enterocloster bolteae (strain ATCC BAA-613 / DSM 15670 / CCUG 46953 / JCM 12243 / WAL 16351) TaxID=411902 RepID=A8RVC2_ENTBW|nr:hypothetical protein CLOBOL_04240 [Enterocloster bolteae ATCC BAA-613]